MAQAKKKQSTKTAKKTTARTQARKKTCTKSTKCRGVNNKERTHVFIVTAMSMIAGILLCANAVIMIVTQ